MTHLIPFAFDSKALRVLVRDGEPWFFASDVCSALDVDVTAVRKLDPDEKGLHSMQTPGGTQDVAVLTESGLFTLALRCRDAMTPGTPAHRFRKWVTAEVLPSIRRTGGYGPQPASTVPAESLAAAQAELLDVQRKLIEAQERLIASGGGRRRVRKPIKPLLAEHIAEMRKLRASGVPVVEIARRLQRSSATVSMMTRGHEPAQGDLLGGAGHAH